MCSWSELQTWVVQNADDPHPELFKLQMLLQYHNIGNNITSNDNTILHFASLGKSKAILQYLLTNTPTNILERQNCYGQTAFHWAVMSENIENVNLFLEFGARVDVVDIDGNTILHWAVERENLEMVKLLVNFCNATDKNVDGQTPLDIAKECKNKKIVRFLKKTKRMNLKQIIIKLI